MKVSARPVVCLALAGCMVFLAACRPDQIEERTEERKMEERVHEMASNTAGGHEGQFYMGCGNFWRDEYVDEHGETVRGVTAGLWLWLAGSTEEDRHVRVHPGQEVDYHGHRIRVIDIACEEGEWFVRLGVSALKEPSD